jgi:DNA-binding transcriptional regulator YhcF (GntR family)
VISTQQGRGTFIASRLSEEQIQRMRLDKLRSMFGQVIEEALVLGYSPQEVRDVVEGQLVDATSAASKAPKSAR